MALRTNDTRRRNDLSHRSRSIDDRRVFSVSGEPIPDCLDYGETLR